MRRITTLLLTATIVSSCGVTPEEVATLPPEALYISSYGPFLPSGPMSTRGMIEVWDGTTSTSHGARYLGTINGGSQTVGRIIVPGFAARVAIRSSEYTNVLACHDIPTGPPYAPCAGQSILPVGVRATAWGDPAEYLPWVPAAFVVGYRPPCPITAGITQLHLCTGAQATFDDSGYQAAILSDGLVQPGLPYGHPLNSPQPPGGTSDVECVAHLPDYGLTWTRPPGYPYGDDVIAVYSGC